MPILKTESVQLNFLLNGAHRQTILPNILRTVKIQNYERERLNLPDGDFVDLDWKRIGSKKLVIALHGLEGSSGRQYITGMIKTMNDQGWDGLGYNFRGCSGENNLKDRFYHSGDIQDLDFLIEKIVQEGKYEQVVLIGFSLGANVALLYAGKKGAEIPAIIKSVVAVSVPCALTTSVDEIHRPKNRHYVIKFLISLKEKVRQKRDLLSAYNVDHILKSRDFTDWDNRLTAPVHGFESALDYWNKVSSLPYLENVVVPFLMLNAENDTFLSPGCYPRKLAEKSKLLYLMTPKWGGHVGFVDRIPWSQLWSERTIAHFLTKILSL